jgi:ADP-ribosyl-[dinitrogen reductase] hydrolase
MPRRTSTSHPLLIDTVAIEGYRGILGMTLCPGKKGPSSLGQYTWDRDLLADTARIANWGADVWLCLMEPEELSQWGVESLPRVASAVSQFFLLPITDVQAPDERFESAWAQVCPIVQASLRAGRKVLIHCRGGLGRTGTIAARLLVEFGLSPHQAIRQVRAARHGAIETSGQEAYVRGLAHLQGMARLHAPSPVSSMSISPAWRSVDQRADRARAGLLGLLIGDALGVPHEFKPPSAILPREQIEMVVPKGYPRSHAQVPAGTWSDDGAQALCLLASLLSRGHLDPEDLARRLLDWRDHGYMAVDGRIFDIGIQTHRALDRIKAGVPALDAGSRSASASGNGSLMRVLAVALWHVGSRDALFALAMRQSRVTHGSMQAQLCCALYCGVADLLLDGVASEDAWSRSIDDLRAHCRADTNALRVLDQDVLNSPTRITPRGTGHVVDALWSARACLQEGDYASVVRAAIALGHDTDTTAAIAGGLAGIRFGEAGIPSRWRADLRGQGLSAPLLEALHAHLS